jgi:hypothetical protein
LNDTVKKKLMLIFGMDNKAAMSGLGAVESKMGMLKKMVISLGLAFVGWKLLAFAKDTAFAAARAETLGVALEVIGRNAGYSLPFLNQTEGQLRKLGISIEGARKSMALFIQSNLELTDITKLSRVAQDLAVVANIGSSEAFTELTEAISKQNLVILKQFGIVNTLERVYGKYATSLGKAEDQLSDTEKKQAFLNAILEEGAKVAGVYEKSMGTVGKLMGSLTSRAIPDMKIALGNLLLPVMQVVIDFMFKFARKIEELANGPSGAAFREMIQRLADRLKDFGQWFLNFVDNLPNKVKSITENPLFKFVSGNIEEIMIVAVLTKVYSLLSGITALATGRGILALLGPTGTILALGGAGVAYGLSKNPLTNPPSGSELAAAQAAPKLKVAGDFRPGWKLIGNRWVPDLGGGAYGQEPFGPPTPSGDILLNERNRAAADGARREKEAADLEKRLKRWQDKESEGIGGFGGPMSPLTLEDAKAEWEKNFGTMAEGPMSGLDDKDTLRSKLDDIRSFNDEKFAIENEFLRGIDDLNKTYDELGIEKEGAYTSAIIDLAKRRNKDLANIEGSAAARAMHVASIAQDNMEKAGETFGRGRVALARAVGASLIETAGEVAAAEIESLAKAAIVQAGIEAAKGNFPKAAALVAAAAAAGLAAGTVRGYAASRAEVALNAGQGGGGATSDVGTAKDGRRFGTVVTGNEQHITISPTVVFQGEVVVVGGDVASIEEAIGTASVRAVKDALATGEISVGGR